MPIRFRAAAITSALVCAGASLCTCAADEGPQREKEPQTVTWKIAWDPVHTHEDGTPLRGPPTYVVETTTDAKRGPWTQVWSGKTNRAEIRLAPGTRCFRAFAVRDGRRSAASSVICGTRPGPEERNE